MERVFEEGADAMSQMYFQESEEPQATVETVAGARQPIPMRRYDAETVQNVISLALRLQAEHQDTTSVEQIEAIGAEVGLDPAFVRLALSQWEAGTDTAMSGAARTDRKAISRRAVREEAEPRIQTLSRRSKNIAVAVPIAYSVFTFFALSAGQNGSMIPLTLFVGGPVVAALTGARLRSKRLGALSGAVLGSGVMISILFDAAVRSRGVEGDLFLPWAILTAAGAAVGLGGAATRQYVPKLYTAALESLARRFPALAEP